MNGCCLTQALGGGVASTTLSCSSGIATSNCLNSEVVVGFVALTKLVLLLIVTSFSFAYIITTFVKIVLTFTLTFNFGH